MRQMSDAAGKIGRASLQIIAASVLSRFVVLRLSQSLTHAFSTNGLRCKFTLKKDFVEVIICVCSCALWYMCASQRTALCSLFASLHLCGVLGIESRSPDKLLFLLSHLMDRFLR